MLRWVWFIAFCLVTHLLLNAQEFPQHETPNIRIDPFQLQYISTNDLAGASDIQYDRKGNVYCTGYLHGTPEDSSFQKVANDIPAHLSKLYFAKYNPAGIREWVLTASSHVRPTAIRVDKKGNLYLAGTCSGRGICFSGTNGTKIISDTLRESGFFLNKYNQKGEILASHRYDGMELNSMELDRDGNIYLAGCMDFRSNRDRSMVRRQSMLLGIDKHLNQKFRIQGDTIGESNYISLSICGDKLMASIIYSGRFDTPEKKLASPFGQAGALLFYDLEGKLKQVLDSADGERMAPGIAVYDEDANIYLATGGYNDPFNLYGFNQDLSLRWHSPVPMYASNTISRILPVGDKIYLCGQGSGVVLGENSVRKFIFRSKGSNDIFMAGFTKSGQLEWLKAAGGVGLEYGSAMAIYKKDLAVFGHVAYGGLVKFNKISFQAKNTLFLAKFKMDSLEKMDLRLPPPPPKEVPLFEVNEAACTCKFNNKEVRPDFIPSAGSFMDRHVDAAKEFPWLIDTAYHYLDRIFISNFTSDASYAEARYLFNAHVFGSPVVEHPDHLLKLRLMPCQPASPEMTVSVLITHTKPLAELEFLAFAKGDTSAKAIYELLASRSHNSPEQVLTRVLYDGDATVDHVPWIKKINKRYGIDMPLHYDNTEDWINLLMQKLADKNINADDFIMNEYVYTKKTGRMITEAEWQNICNLFDDNYDRSLEKLFYENAEHTELRLEDGYAECILDTAMLSAWNPLGDDDQGTRARPAPILLRYSNLLFHSHNGCSAVITNVCQKKSRISGTGAFIKLEVADYVNHRPGIGNQQARNPESYNPEYSRSFSKMNTRSFDSPYQIRADTFFLVPEMETFSGLRSNNGSIWLPVGGKLYELSIRHLTINNRILTAGCILPEGQLQNGTVLLKSDKDTFSMPVKDFITSLKTAGFTARIQSYPDGLLVDLIRRSSKQAK